MHSPADLMFFSLVATAVTALPFLLSYALLSCGLWWISRRGERGCEQPTHFFAPRGYCQNGPGTFRMYPPPLNSPVLDAVASEQDAGEEAA
jgi:hypothetical protein